MRWVGKVTVVLLLFLSAFLCANSAVFRITDSNKTKDFITIEVGDSTLITTSTNKVETESSTETKPNPSTQDDKFTDSPLFSTSLDSSSSPIIPVCKCNDPFVCFLNKNGLSECRCPADKKEIKRDDENTCLKKCEDDAGCSQNQKCHKTEDQGGNVCEVCECKDPFECFLNNKGLSECRCPADKQEIKRDDENTCLKKCENDAGCSQNQKCHKTEDQGGNVCEACECNDPFECFLNNKGLSECRCPADKKEIKRDDENTCLKKCEDDAGCSQNQKCHKTEDQGGSVCEVCECNDPFECFLNNKGLSDCRCPADKKEINRDTENTCLKKCEDDAGCSPNQKCHETEDQGGSVCEECKCKDPFLCFLNQKGMSECKCPADEKEIKRDTGNTCLKKCEEDEECFFNQKCHPTEEGGEGVCEECKCKDPFVCFLNDKGMSDCKCPEGDIEIEKDGVKTCGSTTTTTKTSTNKETTESSTEITSNPSTITEETSIKTTLSTSSTSISTTETTKIPDPCSPNPCQNDGSCKVDGQTFKCDCEPPFSGKMCEEDPCSLNPCENGGNCSVHGLSFKCECPKPYFGAKCENVTDPCSFDPCQNGGRCSTNGISFKCECDSPYKGNMCEIDPCSSNPCQNGGSCSVNGLVFKCSCESPYFGDMCEKVADPCSSNPCQNDGTCENNGVSFKCDCKSPYFGDVCEKVTDPCSSNPCQNGGSCSVNGLTFKCDCISPYFGDMCEKENKGEDACDGENPCKNAGTCVPESENGYKCHCVEGYIGNTCDEIEWCKNYENEICGNTPCQYNLITKSGFCACASNLYFDAKTKTCKEIDRCLQKRLNGECSGDHETCKDGKCVCEDNYAYTENVCKPDFCLEKSEKSRCGENMECKEGHNSFTCSCKERYRQIDEKCVKVDECTPGVLKCEQKCVNGKCDCFTGYKLNENNHTCDRDTSAKDCSLICGKGTCIVEGTEPKCKCPQISYIEKNNTCIDKCAAELITRNECPNGCVSDENTGYKCKCTGKYDFEEDGIHCKAKQVCSEGGGNDECLRKNGFCKDDFALPKGYKCECKFGFKKDPLTDICEHKCKTFNCDKNQAICAINVDNRPECICPPLLIKDLSGKCSKLAEHSYIGDFLVPKKEYQLVNSENTGKTKRDTFKDINYAKLVKNFDESMKNIFEGYKGNSLLNCTDNNEDLNCFLELKLDKDPKETINIVSTPSVCLPLPGESNCLIPPNFVTKTRTAKDAEVFKKAQSCDKTLISKLCGIETLCEKSDKGFKCQCKPGYFRRTSLVPAQDVLVDICEDVDECLNHTICPNTTICHNLPGDYNCKCIAGYYLEEGDSTKVEGCKDVCDPNPCEHGTCSKTGTDGFTCSCEESYTGRFCNQTQEVIKEIQKSGNETAAIVGGVLGAVLLITIIICILLFRKLQKPKSIDDTEVNGRQANHGLVSEMWKLSRRQPETNDIELREHERRPNRETEDRRYNIQNPINPIDSISIPRPQLERSSDKGVDSGRNVPERDESDNYRRGHMGDYRVNPNEEVRRPGRRDEDRQELPRRPMSRSSDHLDIDRYPKSHSSRYSDEEVRQRSQRDGDRQEMPRRPKEYSSRFSGEEVRQLNQRYDQRQEVPRRPLSRSSDHLDNERIGVSKMQFINRGYDGD